MPPIGPGKGRTKSVAQERFESKAKEVLAKHGANFPKYLARQYHMEIMHRLYCLTNSRNEKDALNAISKWLAIAQEPDLPGSVVPPPTSEADIEKSIKESRRAR